MGVVAVAVDNRVADVEVVGIADRESGGEGIHVSDVTEKVRRQPELSGFAHKVLYGHPALKGVVGAGTLAAYFDSSPMQQQKFPH